jgi:hypothetical protein
MQVLKQQQKKRFPIYKKKVCDSGIQTLKERNASFLKSTVYPRLKV